MNGLIDTHAHLDGFARRGELGQVLAEGKAAGVGQMIAIGTDEDDWSIVCDLARGHPGQVHHTVGLHPCSVVPGWEDKVAKMEAFWRAEGPLSQALPPVALGECGLDRFHLPKEPGAAEADFARQRLAFAAQLGIARRLACPVVVHSRGAFQDCVEMIDASGIEWARVVFHCFSEGPGEMAELVRRGGWGSFTGILTYKNADAVRAAALAQGLGKLLLETDAPYLAPVPHRGQPNRPAYIRHTAEFAAGLFQVPGEELAEATTRNARTLFGI